MKSESTRHAGLSEPARADKMYMSLEALRGLAAVAVCIFHSNFAARSHSTFVANSAIFVDFFFVLSGFVIAFAYQEKVREGMDVREFALLRIGRLYPLHLFVLLLWVPYVVAKGWHHFHAGGAGDNPFIHNNAWSFLSNLFLVNSLGLHESMSWNYPAWSISVEIFTYFVFFGLVSFFGRAWKPAMALAMSAFGYCVLFLFSEETLLKSLDLGLFRCIGGFFFGVWLYPVSKQLAPWAPRTASARSLIEVLAVAAMFVAVLISSRSKAFEMIAFLAFGFVVLAFSLPTGGAVSAALTKRFPMWIGTLSYSIYMLHAIVFNIMLNIWEYVLKLPVGRPLAEGGGKVITSDHAVLLNLLGLAVIVLFAHCTYAWIERPCRERFRIWATRFRREAVPSSPELGPISPAGSVA